MLDEMLKSDNKTAGRVGTLQTRARAWERLVATVDELKNSTQELVVWHQYQTMLAAIAPDRNAPSWELHALANALDLKSTTGLQSATKRRDQFFEADSTEEHSMFYKSTRATARSLMANDPEHALTVDKFWKENTSQSSNTVSQTSFI